MRSQKTHNVATASTLEEVKKGNEEVRAFDAGSGDETRRLHGPRNPKRKTPLLTWRISMWSLELRILAKGSYAIRIVGHQLQ